MKGLNASTKIMAGQSALVLTQHATETVGCTLSRTLRSEFKGYTKTLQTTNKAGA